MMQVPSGRSRTTSTLQTLAAAAGGPGRPAARSGGSPPPRTATSPGCGPPSPKPPTSGARRCAGRFAANAPAGRQRTRRHRRVGRGDPAGLIDDRRAGLRRATAGPSKAGIDQITADRHYRTTLGLTRPQTIRPPGALIRPFPALPVHAIRHRPRRRRRPHSSPRLTPTQWLTACHQPTLDIPRRVAARPIRRRTCPRPTSSYQFPVSRRGPDSHDGPAADRAIRAGAGDSAAPVRFLEPPSIGKKSSNLRRRWPSQRTQIIKNQCTDIPCQGSAKCAPTPSNDDSRPPVASPKTLSERIDQPPVRRHRRRPVLLQRTSGHRLTVFDPAQRHRRRVAAPRSAHYEPTLIWRARAGGQRLARPPVGQRIAARSATV